MGRITEWYKRQFHYKEEPKREFKKGDMVKLKINGKKVMIIGDYTSEDDPYRKWDFGIRFEDMSIKQIIECEIEKIEENSPNG